MYHIRTLHGQCRQHQYHKQHNVTNYNNIHIKNDA